MNKEEKQIFSTMCWFTKKELEIFLKYVKDGNDDEKINIPLIDERITKLGKEIKK